MKIDFFLIVFVLLLLHLVIYNPISGYFEVKKLKKKLAEGNEHLKIKFYRNVILWAWLPLVLILLLIPLEGLKPQDIGLKWIDIRAASLSNWLLYPAIGLYILYLLYNCYLIVLLKVHKESGAKIAKSLPGSYDWFLPKTRKEKKSWTWVSVSAGITEEIVYRGYLFFALAVIFPRLSLLYILLITTVIFWLAHLYLGKESIRSALLGLFFGIFYIVFDSVFPIIIAHIAQDLVLRDMLSPGQDLESTSNNTP